MPVVQYVASVGRCLNPWRPFRESGAPFLWIDDWSQLPALLSGLMDQPSILIELQARMRVWYSTFMSDHLKRLEGVLHHRSKKQRRQKEKGKGGSRKRPRQ